MTAGRASLSRAAASRAWRWATASVLAAVAINAGLFWLVSLLAAEQSLPQDLIDPVPVSMVTLPPENPPPPERTPPPPKLDPPRQVDFQPDLQRPSPVGALDLDAGLRVNLGDLRLESLQGEFVFGEAELDAQPRPVSTLPPVYPYRARQRGLEGWVRLKFLVRVDGTVGQVEVLDAQPAGLFEEAVLATVPRWKYEPGRIDGRAVNSWVLKVVRFDLDD